MGIQRGEWQEPTQESPQHPADWNKGELLDVRNMGTSGYHVRKLGEDFDPRKPERTLVFQNSFDCQAFVSHWYQREGGGRPY